MVRTLLLCTILSVVWGRWLITAVRLSEVTSSNRDSGRCRRSGAFVDVGGELRQKVVSVNQVLFGAQRRKRILILASYRSGGDGGCVMAVEVNALARGGRDELLKGGKSLGHLAVVNRLDLVSFSILEKLIYTVEGTLFALVDGLLLVHAVLLRGGLGSRVVIDSRVRTPIRRRIVRPKTYNNIRMNVKR